tara:strand:+ start:1179 stop:1289 length:111 start_codon:yes stop_codon:yes gene_type:complete
VNDFDLVTILKPMIGMLCTRDDMLIHFNSDSSVLQA